MRDFAHCQLPSEFLRHLDDPPHPPASPRPSATMVLLREEAGILEVLLLKRSPRSRFIPGAWVFPGGAVDPEDSEPVLFPRLHGISYEAARDRLGPPDGGPPALAYWVAALRETFEETGILLDRGMSGSGTPTLAEGAGVEGGRVLARSQLLSGEMSFKEVLETLDATLDTEGMAYIGHWLTPECEPRRYETRFFLAQVRPDVRATPHEKELVEALWLTPGDALARNREGELPLVLPTLFTLEELEPFPTPRDAIQHLRRLPVPRRLPMPERSAKGVRFHLAG